MYGGQEVGLGMERGYVCRGARYGGKQGARARRRCYLLTVPTPATPPVLPSQVCNHPDLFEGRSIVSAYDCEPLEMQLPSLLLTQLAPPPLCATPAGVDLSRMGLLLAGAEGMASWEAEDVGMLAEAGKAVSALAEAAALGMGPAELAPLGLSTTPWVGSAPAPPPGSAAAAALRDASPLMRAAACARAALAVTQQQAAAQAQLFGGGAGPGPGSVRDAFAAAVGTSPALRVLAAAVAVQAAQRRGWRSSRAALLGSVNAMRCGSRPLCGRDLVAALTCAHPVAKVGCRIAVLGWGELNLACMRKVQSSTGVLTSPISIPHTLLHLRTQCLLGREAPTAQRDLPSLLLELNPTFEQRAEACDEVRQGPRA